jgi:hypothetical protein
MTPEYAIWRAAIHRCASPKAPAYANYGGRGISVCERWQDFLYFLSDMGRRPSYDHQLDRIDNDGDYEPGNCRWATPKQNSRNRRGNRMVTFRGETLTVAAWCERTGLRTSTLVARLNAGWSAEDALTKQLRSKRSGDAA